MSPRIGLDSHTLVLAATRIADEQGLEAVTLAALAQQLGVRSPSLYNHVDGLPGLMKRLTLHGLCLLKERLTQATSGLTGSDAVHALARAYVAFARAHPGLYETTLRVPAHPELEPIGGELVELIVRTLAPYKLDEEAALHTVRGLRSLLHGFASLEQKGGFGLPLDLDETLHRLLGAFLTGIDCMKGCLPEACR